ALGDRAGAAPDAFAARRGRARPAAHDHACHRFARAQGPRDARTLRSRPAGRVRRGDAGGWRARRDHPAPPRRVPRASTADLFRRGARRARTRGTAPRASHRGSRTMTRARRLGRATFSSLRNRNYRLYFIGQITSVSGTWMQRLAQAWLILRLTHNNGLALGVESGLQFLPVLLFGAWGGVIADRFDKRRLLYATQIAAGLLALGLGLIVAFGA